jgi:hypothetical protein
MGTGCGPESRPFPPPKFWDLVLLYDIPPDPRIVDMLANGTAKGERELRDYWDRAKELRLKEYRREHGEEPWLATSLAKEKDEWDLYVEKFLVEHKLPEPVVKRAGEILDQAKRLREARRRQHAAQIREAKKEGHEKKLDHFEELERKIFDRVLVRNLNKLISDKADRPRTSSTTIMK